MTSAPKLLDFFAEQLTDVETAWSIGTFGAIAEFTRDAQEAAALDRGSDVVSVMTRAGAYALRRTTRCVRLPLSRSPRRAGSSVWRCAFLKKIAP